MSDNPRRAWFQIHLSTAIVLMFVAGVLNYANWIWVEREFKGGDIWICRGMPVPFDGYPKVSPFPPSSAMDYRYTDYRFMVANIVVGLILLALIGVICEYLIRRREARAH